MGRIWAKVSAITFQGSFHRFATNGFNLRPGLINDRLISGFLIGGEILMVGDPLE